METQGYARADANAGTCTKAAAMTAIIRREPGPGVFTAWVRNGVHWYIWRYTAETLEDALREVGTTAAGGQITWAEAAALVRGMRQMVHN